MKRALIAMSGGVDSSVAAMLTKEAGYECVGCTMQLLGGCVKKETEAVKSEADDAKEIANRLGMDFHIIDLSDEFEKTIIGDFVDHYIHGETPNPCVKCNKHMKFGRLFELMKKLGCDKLVTGHYARIEQRGGEFFLKKAADESKDQSYVLYNLNQEILSHTLFPLGGLTKAATRRRAEDSGFSNAGKPESQDICFVPDGDYAAVIRRFLENNPTSSETGLAPGAFVSVSGEKLGEHKGLINYTVGQRKGLGISAQKPLYVLSLCPKDNTVVLGDNDDLFTKEAVIKEVNWISGRPPVLPHRCSVKIRYKHNEQPATIYAAGPAEIKKPSPPGGDDGEYIKVIFDEPQRAITPGQSAVFYEDDVVLGGGIIV